MWDKFEKIIRSNGNRNLSHSQTVLEVLNELGSCSTSVAVLDNGEISTRCFSGIGNDEETVFQACSISKPMAGLAAMRLVDQGRLDLEKSISNYLPDSVLYNLATDSTRHLLQYVTVSSLMSHTSGLTVQGFLGYDPSEPIPSLHELLAGNAPSNSPRVQLACFPGHGFSYSGGGMTVLQLILEHATRKSFPELMQELVFDPLDMHRSFYRSPSSKDNFAPAYV